jgi:hypothetical protein
MKRPRKIEPVPSRCPVRVIPLLRAEATPAHQSDAAVERVAASEVKVLETQVEKVDTRKADAEARADKKRVAERKARKSRQQMDARLRVQPRSSELGIMAFTEEPRQLSFFGNQSGRTECRPVLLHGRSSLLTGRSTGGSTILDDQLTFQDSTNV